MVDEVGKSSEKRRAQQTADTAAGGPGIDWGHLLVYVGIPILVVVVVLLVIWRIVVVRRRARKLREARTARWDKTVKAHDMVLKQYYDMESDPLRALMMPALFATTTDPDSPVAAFLDAMATAGAHRTDVCPESDDWIQDYAVAVEKLQTRWDAAKRFAKHVGTSRLGEQTAKDVNRAVGLLRKARFNRNDFERTALLDAAKKIIDRIVQSGEIRLSERYMDALDAASMPQLESA